MKRFLVIFVIVLLALSGCGKEVEYDEFGNEITPEPTSDTEKALFMINQAIDDYNNGVIKEKEVEWNTTIKPLPIEIESIPNIKSLNELDDIEIKTNCTNTDSNNSNNIFTIIIPVYDKKNNSYDIVLSSTFKTESC